MTRTALGLALFLALPACKDAPSKLDKVMIKAPPSSAVRVGAAGDCLDKPAVAADIDSKDVLARTKVADKVFAKHVLLSWKDLGDTYRGRGQDPRGAARSAGEAATLAQEILAKMKADPSQIDALVKEYGEDPGAKSGDAYEIEASTGFVPEFKNLALRLEPNEAGIVKTTFGYHVIMRVAAPAPDPIESVEILGRPAGTGEVHVQHILIKYKGAPAARDATRSREEAQARVKEVLGKMPGAKFEDLMKEYSEDPGSKDSGRVYDVTPAAGMVAPFKDLSLRLNQDEFGVVKSPFGYHLIKRVAAPPPPPPDGLDSVDILKRQPVTDNAQVKHILLSWSDIKGAGDPRGQKRTRAELEKLVKETIAKLKGGAAIEPLMKELSEDPGSAASGEAYPVTPTAGLVEPFKNLSLRLNPGEVGAVKSDFGIHIIKRTDDGKAPAAPAAPAEAK